MNIYTADGARQYYGTQSKIVGAEMQDDHLIIYEEGKSIPWEFTKTSIVVNRARFDEKSEKDVEYVTQKLGLSKEDIPSLNDYEAYVSYVMTIEPKVLNPIVINFNDEKYNKDCYYDSNTGRFKIPFNQLDATIHIDGVDEILPLSNGVMLDSGRSHYGFKVISARKQQTFPTQCRLFGVQLVDGLINVLEEGKYVSWKIDNNGDVIDYAKFLDIYQRDIDYLRETFGLSRDNIANVNSYGLKYVNKEK